MITQQQINTYFEILEKKLLERTNRFALHELSNFKEICNGSGIYCVFDKDVLCYVGESGHILQRLSDFNRTLNHTFRRNLAAVLYAKHEQYWVADASRKFHETIEQLLDDYVEENITVSVCQVRIGRKEFEEWMQARYSNIQWLNKRKNRKAY